MQDPTTDPDFDPETDDEYLARKAHRMSGDYKREQSNPFTGAVFSRTQAMATLGCVLYAIRTQDGLIKIGYTANLATRMRAYNGRTLLAVKAGTRASEKEVHRQLAANVAHGREYYHPTPEVMALVNEWRSDIGLPLAS